MGKRAAPQAAEDGAAAPAEPRKCAARPRVVGLDCEMVGTGPRGKKSVLIRVSVVDRRGHVLMDSLVEPEVEVTDWRTKYTGLDERSFAAFCDARREGRGGEAAEPRIATEICPSEVLSVEDALLRANRLLDAALIVGHDLRHDLKQLRRFHQRRLLLRDTAFCPLLRAGLDRRHSGGPPGLRALAAAWLEEDLHDGRAHCSVEDARAAMLLYRLIAPEWEKYSEGKFGSVPPEATERTPRNARPRGAARPMETADGSAAARATEVGRAAARTAEPAPAPAPPPGKAAVGLRRPAEGRRLKRRRRTGPDA